METLEQTQVFKQLAKRITPLGTNGNRLYRTAVFDYLTDTSLELPQKHADVIID